ncbi:MAG: hypothetical protein Q9166_000292 [cf. Caloplaca sp. 2 TL-2023]
MDPPSDLAIEIKTPGEHEAEDYREFVQLMHRTLPQEMLDLIEEWFCEMVFCPGYIYTKSYPRKRWSHEPLGEYAAGPSLLTLNKRVLARYERRMWAENTWVIGVGDPSLTTDFLFESGSGRRLCISRVEMAFTIRDSDKCWEAYSPTGGLDMIGTLPKEWVEANKGCAKESLDKNDQPGVKGDAYGTTHESFEEWCAGELVQDYRQPLEVLSHQAMTYELLEIWSWKWYALTRLPLAELLLDFTECYGPDGQWLGLDVAYDMDPVVGDIFAAALKVRAPDVEKERELLKIIRRRLRGMLQ